MDPITNISRRAKESIIGFFMRILYHGRLTLILLIASGFIFCQMLGFVAEYSESERLREFGISQLVMADVGQGDGFMIRTSDGHVALIDVGQFGERFIASIRKPAFLNFGKKESLRADLIFLSHDDADHAGALAEVWHDFNSGASVGSLVASPYMYTNIDDLNIENEKVIKSAADDVLKFSDAMRIEILWPEDLPVKKTKWPNHSNESDESEYSRRSANDDSVVMKVAIASTTILFTGDISEKVEKKLVEKFANDLKVDILKVGHHGSKSSSDAGFIKMTNPHMALISVGKNNRYKHPSAKALKRLKQDGRAIIRTDKCGTARILIFQNGAIGRPSCFD